MCLGADAASDGRSAVEALEEAREVSLEDLPPLPRRSSAYYSEPVYGVLLVAALCASMLSAMECVASLRALSGSQLVRGAVLITRASVLLAACCTACLVLGGAGEIRRSQETALPVPDKVRWALLAGQGLTLTENIKADDGSSYCVRCLVWRRSPGAHHCRICNRCVDAFDHHCGVFGRCITEGNMLCFRALFVLLFAGFCALVLAAALVLGAALSPPRQEALLRAAVEQL